MRMLWCKFFLWSSKMRQDQYLLGASGLVEATFSIKNACPDLKMRARKPWVVPNRSPCAFEQSAEALAACFMCSWRRWLIRGRVHVQNGGWLSKVRTRSPPLVLFSRVFSVVLIFIHSSLRWRSWFNCFFNRGLCRMDGWRQLHPLVYAAWQCQGNLPVNLMSTSAAATKVIPGRSLSYSNGSGVPSALTKTVHQLLRACLNCNTGVIKKPKLYQLAQHSYSAFKSNILYFHMHSFTALFCQGGGRLNKDSSIPAGLHCGGA